MTDDERAAREAAIIETMHTGDYTPDLEYTPITAPLPELVRAAELTRLRAEITELHSDYSAQVATLQLRVRELERRAEAAEKLVVRDSDLVYELIGELCDATGRTRADVEAEFLGKEPL